MMSESESELEVFDIAAATDLVKKLRRSFTTGRTRSYEWRVSQLESLLKLSVEHEEDLCEALRSDLSKPVLESIVHEVFVLKLNSFTVLMLLLFAFLSFFSFEEILVIVYDFCDRSLVRFENLVFDVVIHKCSFQLSVVVSGSLVESTNGTCLSICPIIQIPFAFLLLSFLVTSTKYWQCLAVAVSAGPCDR